MTGLPMEQLQKIIDDVDYQSMFQLENTKDFSIVLGLILNEYHDCKDLNTLPRSHKMLYLCKVVEDCCQAECIETFYEWGFSKYKDDTYTALIEINAPITAEAFKQSCIILDKQINDSTIIKEDCSKLMNYDSTISDYPDGHFSKLFRDYANKHRADFI